IQGIARGTFSLLDLSKSTVEKGIFIGRMECKNNSFDLIPEKFNQVMIYASKDENLLSFSKLDSSSYPKYFYCFSQTEIIETTENIAIWNYYKNFGKTIQKSGEVGESLLLEFQKTFFGKSADLPIHQIYSTLIKASLYDQGTEKRME